MLGLEDLMNVKVGGGTMPLRALKDVTAAVYVLTSDDIMKSGAITVPDMLRMVPGVHVAQIDANKWIVSIRGFASRFANKLQVLIDGRSIYSTGFSGVYWDQIGLMPDQIERIEVIRGSDGALWGSNAVNGIINIVTKNSADTQGGYFEENATTNGAGDHYLRFGGVGKNSDTFRISARTNRVRTSEPDGYPAKDGSQSSFFEFRSDRKLNSRDSMTMGSSLYTGKLGQSTFKPSLSNPSQIIDSRFPVSDFNLSAAIVSKYSLNEVSELKFNFNRNLRVLPEASSDSSTFDLDYNRSSRLSESSSLFYGGAIRHTDESFKSSSTITFSPEKLRRTTYSAYAQFEKDLNPKTQLTLGSTVLHSVFSGLEFQPSARILYRKDPTESFWFSASRAVRTPSPTDKLATVFLGVVQDPISGLPVQLIARTNNQFQSEAVVSAEIGWRKQTSDSLLIDLTAFYNSYTNLTSIELVDNQVVMDAIPHIESNYMFRNGKSAKTYGLEASFKSQMNDDWSVTGNFTYIGDHFSLKPGVVSLTPLEGLGNSGSVPKWQANLRSSWSLSDSLKFDLSAYYVGANRVFQRDAYTRMDTRIAWQMNPDMQLTLIGQNLFSPNHSEATSSFNEIPVSLRRSFSLQLGFRF